jgi:hypothetical protein
VKKLVRPLVVAWWAQMKTREWLTGARCHVPQKNIMLFAPIGVDQHVSGELATAFYKAWSPWTIPPPNRQNFEMVLSCRYAEVLWSWCNRQFARVCMDTGSASHISQQHISPVNKCPPNIQCISNAVIVLCIQWEWAAFSSWVNETQLEADNSSSPTVLNKSIYFFPSFSIRHRVRNHFMFNPLKTKRSHRDCRFARSSFW